ncbi:UPF0489 family protein [Peribacillus simplex]|uniref:UPF0489 family protein n=1 Tax=Peribacillus simplex TaxID=1478 RepID=UPI003D281F7C
MMDKIYVYEEHSEVFSYWVNEVPRNSTLVYFDQHLDLKFIENSKMKRISQFIKEGLCIDELKKDIPCREDGRYSYGIDDFLYAAIQEGLFRKIIWVYPRMLGEKGFSDLLWGLLSLVPNHGKEFISSFRNGKNSASVQLNNIELHVTTIEYLREFIINEQVIVDIDLDYFYDPKTNDLSNDIDETLNVLNDLGLFNQVKTMTYSIKSGFLPESFRWMGEYIAGQMGRKIVYSKEDKFSPKVTMEKISSNKKLSLAEIDELNFELRPLGAIGWKLKSILYTQSGEIELAKNCYQIATKTGDDSYWAAYVLGIHFFKDSNYEEALNWFSKTGNIVDTIEAHGLILRLICCLRLELYQKGYDLSKECIELLPMRIEGYILGEVFASKLGMKLLDFDGKIHYVPSQSVISRADTKP